MTYAKSWVESANSSTTNFPLNNLPCGVFSVGGGAAHCGVAIGNMIVDITELEARNIIAIGDGKVFDAPSWNKFMAQGHSAWSTFRKNLASLLEEGSPHRHLVESLLIDMPKAQMRLPFQVAGYTDFYASRNHAFNVGSMFRDPANALPPNWLHIPIGYNGRASSVVVSGSKVRRPYGQLKGPTDTAPRFDISQKFDFELELGAIVGQGSDGMVSPDEADEMIFGFVLLNDWSARDIQAWEYQPLGPFQAKATATTVSPWIVMKLALEPFRQVAPVRDVPLLPYLRETRPGLYRIYLEAALMPSGGPETVITRTDSTQLYYSFAQQLCHHTSSGCPMDIGDLLGSGTISGPEVGERGSLLEISWNGKEPLTLQNGVRRTFIEDGDTVIFRGYAQGDGYRVGFGECSGTVEQALTRPAWA